LRSWSRQRPIRGGFDTTISGIAFAPQQLASQPAWWDWLCDDVRRAGVVFDEARRRQSPAQVMFRATVPDGARLGGHDLEGRQEKRRLVTAYTRYGH
jgi:cytochrome P450